MLELERLLWTKVVLVLALGWAFYHLRRLWRTERCCPKAPLFEGFPRLRHETVYYRVLVLLLLTIGLAADPVLPTVLFATLVALFCVTDWTICRPLIYQFTTMLMVMALCTPQEGLGICRLIPVCIYFWSGVLKLNTNFLQQSYPWIIGALSQRLPIWLRLPLARAGPAIPFLEATLGLGLLFPSTRAVCLAGAVGMHLFILLCFSSFGHRTHGEIWPWNLGMMLSSLILFSGTSEITAYSILLGASSLPHYLALLVFGVLPVLGLTNKIDPIFSHAHMAGRHDSGGLLMTASLRARLPDSVQELCRPLANTELCTLDLGEWFMSELQVPPPKLGRAVKAIARDFARYDVDRHELQLITFSVQGLYTMHTRQQNYTWTDLVSAAPETRIPDHCLEQER